MKRVINWLSSNSGLIFIGFILYTLVVMVLHILIGDTVVSDDAERLAAGMGNLPFIELVRGYWNSNGRATIDALAEVMVVHYTAWKILDILCYIVIAVISCFVLKVEKYREVFVLLALILLIPFRYFNSAGYASTTVNYWFTAASVLFIVLGLILVKRNSKNKFWGLLVAVVGLSFAMFHDQYMVVALLIELMVMIHMLIWEKKTDDFISRFICIVAIFILSVIAFLKVFFSPGHMNRMGLEPYWFPEYSSWTFGTKILRGFTSTVAVLIFKYELVFVVLCLLLAILGLLSRGIYKKIIGVIPLTLLFIIAVLGRNRFIFSNEFMYGLPDINPYSGGLKPAFALAVSIVCVVMIFVALFVLLDDASAKFYAIGVMFIGAVSREMMGFSATIYMSSYRTFIPLLMCIVFVAVIVFKEIEKRIEK